MLGALRQNISYAIRTLFKNRSFTIVAVLLPAWRASRVEPLKALRQE